MPFSDGSQNWKAYSCTMRTNETAYAPKICPHGIAAALGAVRACLSYLCFGSVGMATIDVPPVLAPYALFSSNFHANLQLQNSLFWSMRPAGRNFTVSQGKKQPSLSDSAGQPPVLPRRVKQISRKGARKTVAFLAVLQEISVSGLSQFAMFSQPRLPKPATGVFSSR